MRLSRHLFFKIIANMTQLHRTPEDIFRAEGKDVNFLHFNEVDESQVAQTRREMQDWLALHLPGTHTEPMRSSEIMGFLTGGPVGLRVDFSPKGLLAFCTRWENPATGQSLDPRFQCYLMRYADWFAEHGHFVPSLDKPGHVGTAIWIDTPLGVLTHVLPPPPAEQLRQHPAHHLDLWMHAVKQWPALKALDADTLVHGRVMVSERDPSGWWVVYTDDLTRPLEASRQAQILAWLGLPVSMGLCRHQ